MSDGGLGLKQRGCPFADSSEPIPLNHPSISPTVASKEDEKLRDNVQQGLSRRTRRTEQIRRTGISGFCDDVRSGRWMLVPSSALILWLIPVAFQLVHTCLIHLSLLPPTSTNIARQLTILAGRQADGAYTKEYWPDVLFVAHQIVAFSFIRQFLTIYVLRPLAIWLGVVPSKVSRFTEQAYGLCYWGVFSISGIVVMKDLPVWWFQTDQAFHTYPHTRMTFGLKLFYLLQASYWMQQMLILLARIEKPRSDFNLLIAHHIVTLYLIIGSYCCHFTHMGLLVFITMDTSDWWFCLAKCANYISESSSKPIFAIFIVAWTYCRHYLHYHILSSIWRIFDLLPANECMTVSPSQDKWCAPSIHMLLFLPVFLLQLMNLYWGFLILRILYRALRSVPLKDDRSDDEDEGEEGVIGEGAAASPVGGKLKTG